MDVVEDQFVHIRTEWNVLKEKWFSGEPIDPVFEGMVKDFCVFDSTMRDIYKEVEVFMKGVDSLAEGLMVLSESTIAGLTHVDDPLIKSDCCKMKEAANQITRADAPHSAIAKLRRDMDFNIINPIRNHLANNTSLKNSLEKRRRQLLELNSAKKRYEECEKKNFSRTDRRFLQARSSLESAKMSFQEVDKKIFEWLYILEEYRGDILDSALQTLKYLQYEFFATAAHAISGVLPARMEFRPMVEMTPEHLEAQVDMELQETEDNEEDEVVTDFSVRLIEKLAKDNKNKPGEGVDSCSADVGPAMPVDPLSLSSLLMQGFEEGPARQALRKHQNNTQAAMDWLIHGECEETENVVEDKVRMPTTIKRVQRLKARRHAQQEKRRRQEEEEKQEEKQEAVSKDVSQNAEDEVRGNDGAGAGSTSTTRIKPTPVDLMEMDTSPEALVSNATMTTQLNLLDFDEPPPPTDFSKQIETKPLPPMQSFDVNKCEKQPLPASVAAGTAQMRPAQQPALDLGLLGSDGTLAATPSPESFMQDQTAATQILPTQPQITPEHLLLAAQQTALAQGQVQQPPYQPNAPSPPLALSLESADWSGTAATVPEASQDTKGHYSSLQSLDPLLM